MAERVKIGYRGYEIRLDQSPYNYDSSNVIEVEFIAIAGSAVIEGITIVSTANAPEAAKVFKAGAHWNEKLGMNFDVKLSGQHARVLVREKYLVS